MPEYNFTTLLNVISQIFHKQYSIVDAKTIGPMRDVGKGYTYILLWDNGFGASEK